MAIARVQGTKGVNATGSTADISTTAFAATNTLGNAIIVNVAYDADTGRCTKVTDTAGNSYKFIAGTGSAGANCEVWAAFNIKAQASNVIKATVSFTDGAVIAEEWSGLATVQPFDTAAASSNIGSTTMTSGTAPVTAFANELVWMAVEQDFTSGGTLSVGTGYSNFTSANSTFVIGAIQSKVVAATGAQSGTMTTSMTGNTYRMLICTFADTSVLRGNPLLATGVGI